MIKPVRSVAMLLMALTTSVSAKAACLDLSKDKLVSFEGTVNFRIFGGPPYNGGVTRGDTPEPTYILKLDKPVCATGDEFADEKQQIDLVQIYPSHPSTGSRLWKILRASIGRRIRVEGTSTFAAHTAHHHAPLLLPITRIGADVNDGSDAEPTQVDETKDSDPTEAYGTAMTTVQAFYLALRAGSGGEAARFVVPEKRATGPLSAEAMTRFYRNLEQPLWLIGVDRLGAHEYKARYRFVARGQGQCDGAAVVRTVARNGENLISSIKALNGC